ncbi:MAG: S1/P1 nuclease, partial [Cyclobacteriaceae bacterium]
MRIVVVVVLISAFFGHEVLAWGATGHRASGYIAEQYLKPRAKKKLKAILQGESLAMVSTWMDEIRSDSLYNYAEDWHWATIP